VGTIPSVRVEPIVAGLITLIGIGLTTVGILSRVGVAIAPGSVLVLGGAAWLGNALARGDVRLLPARREDA
jgi:hypothetical protein